jgi:hypothetical protein
LNRGDHRAAETHFREALRLNPSFEPAREGLLTSFRARSPIYRSYLNYCIWMSRLKGGARWAVVLGLYFGFRILGDVAEKFSPGLAIGIGVLYFVFVLWVYIADPVGNFILLFDRFARYALRTMEKVEAAVVGGSIIVGLASLIAGIALDFFPAAILGGALVSLRSRFPWSSPTAPALGLSYSHPSDSFFCWGRPDRSWSPGG